MASAQQTSLSAVDIEMGHAEKPQDALGKDDQQDDELTNPDEPSADALVGALETACAIAQPAAVKGNDVHDSSTDIPSGKGMCAEAAQDAIGTAPEATTVTLPEDDKPTAAASDGDDGVLEPSTTEDLVWGVQELFHPKAILGSFVCQSLTHALGWAFLAKMFLGPPETKLLFQLCAALLFGISNTCYVGTVVWYLRIMHGGWPLWLIYVFDAVTFLVSFLEVMVLKQSKFGLLAMLGVALPIIILIPGRRRWFVMKWSIVRIIFQLIGTVALQNLPTLQAKMPDNLAPFVFPIGAMIYKAVCVPALFGMWRYGGRDDAPMFPVVLILGSIKYSSEALFLSGIVISFAMKPTTAVFTSLLSVVYHTGFTFGGRFALTDQISYRVMELCWPRGPKRSYLKEYIFRISATQSYVMWYCYAYLASLVALLAMFGCQKVGGFLFNPALWAVLGLTALVGVLTEFGVARGMMKLREQHGRERWSFMKTLLNLHKADANVGMMTSNSAWRQELVQERRKEGAVRKASQEMEDFACIGWRLMGLLLALDTSTAFLGACVSAMLGKGVQMAMAAAAAQ